MYSIAFVRFVNGVVDAQQKGVFAGSVAGIAESLGLPAWFVDLRHSGTHDRLPSISVLRSGCHQALQWLNDNYWIVQTTYLNNTATDVQELLVTYSEATTQGDTKSANAAVKEIVSIIIADNYRDFLIPVLITSGFLVPESKKTRSKYTDLSLHPEVQNLWTDPLNVFESAWPAFVEDLLLVMIGTFVDPSKTGDAVEHEDGTKSAAYSMSYQSTLAAWSKHLLKAKVINNPKSHIANEDGNSLIDLIVEACLANPNVFSKHVLADIAASNKELAALLKPFISFVDDTFKSAVIAEKSQQKRRKSKSSSSTTDMNSTDPTTLLSTELTLLHSRIESTLYEAQDAAADAEATDNENESGDTITTAAAVMNPWTAATHLSWHRVPLGHVPGMGLPCLDVSVEVDDVVLASRIGVLCYPVVEVEPVVEEGLNERVVVVEGGDVKGWSGLSGEEASPTSRDKSLSNKLKLHMRQQQVLLLGWHKFKSLLQRRPSYHKTPSHNYLLIQGFDVVQTLLECLLKKANLGTIQPGIKIFSTDPTLQEHIKDLARRVLFKQLLKAIRDPLLHSLLKNPEPFALDFGGQLKIHYHHGMTLCERIFKDLVNGPHSWNKNSCQPGILI
ncbi:rRNA-processing protein las1 [Podochytrium sp. JEL0797]|nr:rRNA-processing protein las1 [Podochytrium sp. JEL0797]